MAVNIDLIIPGLFDLPVDALDSSFLKYKLPALNQLLRFGRGYRNQAFDLDSMLIDSMGWDDLQALPFAQAYASKETRNSDRNLLFRAIHLKADMYSAIVLPLDNNKVNNDDISIIINDLKDLFKVDCDITEVKNGLWLMHLSQCTPAQHYPHFLSIIGRKADPYIEQSRQALPWYKLVNEMQMFMHQHDINHDRQASGLLPINSLWLWGAGNLPEFTVNNIKWYCDDELLRQFASVSGLNCANLDEVQAHEFSSDSVIVDIALLEALKIPGASNLEALLSNMETALFKPLLQGIKSNRCKLRLRFGSPGDLILNRYSTYQWWKKSLSLVDFATQ